MGSTPKRPAEQIQICLEVHLVLAAKSHDNRPKLRSYGSWKDLEAYIVGPVETECTNTER